MIRIDRTKVLVPAALDGADSDAETERNKAVRFYRLKVNAQVAFDYSVYKDPSVIVALQKLFHGKCAYCESYYKGTQPVDVEHFRPKGGVAIEAGLLKLPPAEAAKKQGKTVLVKPGYYWLASDWYNLLPSCIDCNRERTHEFPEEGPGKGGKANKFPLKDEKLRAKRPGHEAHEEPLLLNPCLDDPELHLEFDESGNVIAKNNSDRGAISIAIFGLRRPGLVDCRRFLAIDVVARIKRLKRLERKKLRVPNDPEVDFDIREEMTCLKRYADPTSPYSAMSRQLIGRFYRAI